MKRNELLLIIALTCCLPIIAFAGFNNDDVYTVKTVVIDAGHGGKDPGAIGVTNVREKDVALIVTKLLGGYIEQYLPDVKVIYTRDTDEFIELYERARIANENNADLFISIHCNSTGSSSPYGTETWVLGLHKADQNLEVVKRENSVIELEDNADENYINPNSPEFHIKLQMRQTAFLDQSIQLASLVEDQFVNRVSRKSRGVKQAGFVVLYKTTMPSVLIELGFLSNPTEEKFLASTEGQEYMASAIYRAVKGYKQKVDGEAEVVISHQQEFEAKQVEKANIEFRVQVLASNKPIKEKSKLHTDFPELHEEQLGEVYRYYAGIQYSYDDVKEKLQQAVDKGYKDAFIVSYKEGKRISVSEARAALK